jgi:hypothetical protein
VAKARDRGCANGCILVCSKFYQYLDRGLALIPKGADRIQSPPPFGSGHSREKLTKREVVAHQSVHELVLRTGSLQEERIRSE